MDSLGDRIRKLRNEKDISQSTLGKYLGVGKTTISNYETGYSTPDNEILAKLSSFFNVSTDYLLGVSDNRSNDQEELPDDFKTPEEAIDFLLNKNVIMGFGGFDVDKLSDEDKVQFAHELLEHLKLLSYKYRK